MSAIDVAPDQLNEIMTMIMTTEQLKIADRLETMLVDWIV